MKDFSNLVLPKFLNDELIGGPSFKTDMVSTISGREIRYPRLKEPVYRYKLQDLCITREQLSEFSAFFAAVKGSAYGFCVKDFADYQATNQELFPDNDNPALYQIHKAYKYTDRAYRRRILKPVPDSVKIFINDNAYDAKVEYDDGIIDVGYQLTREERLTSSFEFYVPVRFQGDNFNYKFRSDGMIALSDLELIEVKS